MQIPREAFNFDPSSAKPQSEVDVIGAAIDDRGLIYTFKQVLTVTLTRESAQTPVVWNQQLPVRPGLYQVRVAVRERGTSRVGSAMEWIEVPSLAPATLSMSSLFLGERPAATAPADKPVNDPQPVRVDVDHRFARTSVLRYQTYVYNPARNAGGPDVWIDARVLRGSQPVMIVAPSKIPPDVSPDSWRLPYWSEIALNQLPHGAYTLQVSASDKVSGTSMSRRVVFTIE